MSDSTQGEGWWQASDGKWYAPEEHPDFQAGATQAMESAPPPTAAMPVSPPPPPGAPVGPPPGGPEGPPPGAPGSGSNNTKWIIVGVLAVAAVAIAAFLLLGGDDDDQKVTASSSSPSASSSSSSSKSSSSSSKSSSSSTKSSSSATSSSSSPTDADIQKKMLTASEVGPGFTDGTFSPDNTGPTFCGATNLNQQVPPLRDVGSTATTGVAFFQEEARAYSSSADAQKVLDIIKNETSCPAPTVQGGGVMSFDAPQDVTGSMTTPVEEAILVNFQTEEAQGQFYVIKDTVAIVIFTFGAQQGTDTTQLPDALDVVNKGLKKIVTP